MPNKKDVKGFPGICKFALNDAEELVYINDVPLEYRERGPYFSYIDHSPMIARKGKTNVWHFAHKDSTTRCGETDIHKLGKLAFKQEFDKPGPFWVTISDTPHHCRQAKNCKLANRFSTCNRVFPQDFDLKLSYVECKLEEEVLNGAFRADVCLIPKDSSRKPMLIEIFHSRESSEAKKQSGLPLIEITFKQEEDVKLFSTRKIVESENISFYGLQPRLSFPTDDVYRRPITIAEIDSDQVLSIRQSNCFDLSAAESWFREDNSLMAVVCEGESDYRKMARLAYQVAYRNGLQVRDCKLCKQHNGFGCSISYRITPARPGTRNRALKCKHFELKENIVFPEHPSKNEEYNNFFLWLKGKGTELTSQCLYHGRDYGILLMEDNRASMPTEQDSAYYAYLSRVIDCYYQVTHDVPLNLLSLYAEEAVMSGRFVALKENTARDFIIDGLSYGKVYAYVPILVSKLPNSLVI